MKKHPKQCSCICCQSKRGEKHTKGCQCFCCARERGEPYPVWNKGKKTNSAGMASTSEKEQLRREKISKKMKVVGGGYRIGSGRSKGCWYQSIEAGKVYLDSSYELLFAKHLDNLGLRWVRNTTKFSYFWKDKFRSYTPDFYLKESKTYVEIKGYVTQKDWAKWSEFPDPIIVFKGWEEAGKVYLNLYYLSDGQANR